NIGPDAAHTATRQIARAKVHEVPAHCAMRSEKWRNLSSMICFLQGGQDRAQPRPRPAARLRPSAGKQTSCHGRLWGRMAVRKARHFCCQPGTDQTAYGSYAQTSYQVMRMAGDFG